MTRVATMLTTVVTSITLGSSGFVDPPKSLIWNASASAPIGLYAVQPADHLDVTDLVAVMPPPLIAEFLADRGYLRPGVSLVEATDILWTCSSTELYELLALQRKWPPARFAQFITDVLVSGLLPR